jgi:hypothetical protein
MQKSGADYIEVNLSEPKSPNETLEEESFQEKVISCEQRLDDAMENYKHEIPLEGSNVSDALLLKQVENLKAEYTELVCESCEEDYRWWLSETVDRLLCGCIENAENDNPEKSEKLMEIFELYRKIKATRDLE